MRRSLRPIGIGWLCFLTLGLGLLGCTAARIASVDCVKDADCGAGSHCTLSNACQATASDSSADNGARISAEPPVTLGDAGPREGFDRDAGLPGNDTGASVPPRDPPPALVLDDFEDLDPFPRDARFDVWQHYTFNPMGQPVYSWSEGPGDDSNVSIHLQWAVRDTANGTLEYPGAGLRTVVLNGYLDLSAYTRIVLSHRYDPPTDGCKPITRFGVSLSCGEYETSYNASVPVSAGWVTVSLPLASFIEPDYLPPTGTPLATCLAVADGVNFGVQSDLMDGECSSGILSLDSISLR